MYLGDYQTWVPIIMPFYEVHTFCNKNKYEILRKQAQSLNKKGTISILSKIPWTFELNPLNVWEVVAKINFEFNQFSCLAAVPQKQNK